MSSTHIGREPPRARKADARLGVRVRRASLLWWAAAFVFSCLLNFIAEAPRDWPGDFVNYLAGCASGAAWSEFLVWRLERRRRAGLAEGVWAALGLAAIGGCLSGLVAGLACWPVIVTLHLGQIVSYQIGFDIEHYTTLSVAWCFIYFVHLSVERRSRVEENVARLQASLFKAEDAALREQVQPDRLREYFSRLNAILNRRHQGEAEDLVLALSEGLRTTLSSRAVLPEEADVEGACGRGLGFIRRFDSAIGAKFFTKFQIINVVFWCGSFLLLFVTLAPTYARSDFVSKMYVVSNWGMFCIVGCVFGVMFVRVWRSFLIRATLTTKCAALVGVCFLSAFVSSSIVSVAAEGYWDHKAPSGTLIAISASYYFFFYAVWHCVYFYVDAMRRELDQRSLLAQTAEAAAAARNSMLRYQVRPHFLFNALNALFALIADGHWERAGAMTEALSAYIERSFAEDERELVPICEQAEALRTYLSIERVRFGDRLHVRLDIPERLAAACAPSLILQPLIENAMKYAVGATADPVEVEVAAELVGDALLLRVRDSGGDAEAPAAPGLGIGLRNVAARLAGHYGARGSLECKRLTPKGFVAEIRLPLEFACIPSAA